MKITKLRSTLVATAVVVAIGSSAALAAVTFDPATGTGFVGKGDVQQPWGWNNATMNKNVDGVEFTYRAEDEYAAVCTFTTGEGTKGEKVHNVARERATAVLASVTYETRNNKQGNLTGFTLGGKGVETVTGDALPVVGGQCSGGGPEGGEWTSVELVDSSGGLYATHSLTTEILIWAPVATE